MRRTVRAANGAQTGTDVIISDSVGKGLDAVHGEGLDADQGVVNARRVWSVRGHVDAVAGSVTESLGAVVVVTPGNGGLALLGGGVAAHGTAAPAVASTSPAAQVIRRSVEVVCVVTVVSGVVAHEVRLTPPPQCASTR